MKYLIIAVEPGGETSKSFKRLGIDFQYVACECGKERFEGHDTIFYKCSGQHGCNIARRHALEIPDAVQFDDDYKGFQALGMFGSGIKPILYKEKADFERVIEAIAAIEKANPKVILGGYSAGAPCGVEARAKQNIMQIFYSGKITRFFRKDSDLYRNDDDICACIMAKRRGYATLGLWSIMRAVQTPEGVDNTNRYDNRSWAKSFLPILYAPTAAKVVWCRERRLKGGEVRPGRFHHKMEWSKITPKMVERKS